MTTNNLSQANLIEQLTLLANEALPLWGFSNNANAELINVSENATFVVTDNSAEKTVLRIHRENYHSKYAIESELAWLDALRTESGIITPLVIPGSNGERVQTLGRPDLTTPRHMVLFEFVSGVEPDESESLTEPFRGLGRLAAQTHLHSLSWKRDDGFERLTWDLDTFFGPNPTWGHWRNGPNVDDAIRKILEPVEQTIKNRLSTFGKSAEKFGLIHADMRLANLLIDNGNTRLIDFDDCGFGWYLYDFAAGISFMEDHPQIPKLKEAWVAGYREIRAISDDEEAEIDTFIMMRRLALLAWMGTHPDVDIVIEMAPKFAQISADLGRQYLENLR